MPAISMFYGVIVYMYFIDNKQHHRPHIHVKYQEDEVIVSIPDGEVLEGSIPSSKMKLLQAWIELHKDELVADWQLAIQRFAQLCDTVSTVSKIILSVL